MADNLDKKLKQIEDALKRLNRLGGDTTIFNTDNITNLETAERILRSIQNDIDDIDVSARSTYNSFAGIVAELTKGKSTTQQIVKGTRDLFNVSQNLFNTTEGVYQTSVKQLKKDQEKAKIQFSNLKLLKDQRDVSESQKRNIIGILGLEKIFIKQLDEAVREAENVEESLGATGALIKAITDIPGLSKFSSYFKLDEANEAMREMSQRITDTVKGTESFKKRYDFANKIVRETSDEITDLNQELEKGNLTQEETVEIEEKIAKLKIKQEKAQAGIARLNADASELSNSFAGKTIIAVKGLTVAAKNFASSLMDPTVIFTALVKAAGGINKEIVGLQKNLNLSYDEAQEVRKEFSSIANSQEDTFISTKKLIVAQSQFNEALGLQGRINFENAKVMADLTERLGIAAESAAQLQLFAESTGADFEQQKLASYEIAQSVSSQYGVQLNIKQVMDDVGKAGAYALVQNQGSVEALTEAVAKAKALGMTLQDVNSIAGKLLEFESSISNELQAELLIGRDINLERARLAALNNDQVTLMEEINSQMGDFNDFQNMNRIQQEAFAESLGMSVDQMSDMLLLEQYRGKNFEQIAAEQGEEVAKRVEALSTQERFNASIEKMQDIVANLVQGPLGDMANLLSQVLGSTTSIGALFGIMGGVQLIKMITGFTKFVRVMKMLQKAAKGTAVANAIGAVVKNPLLGLAGVAAAGLAGAAIANMITSNSQEGDDVLSKPQGASGGYGSRVLLGPEGAISLNNKDTVIAGTDLFRGNDVISAGAGQINIPQQNNRTGEKTNMLLEKLIGQNAKKPEMSPVGLYEIS
jgi:hypothetical protein